ncbi:MAG: CopG family transcriptional regulator [Pseudonocardiaceae bacterium]
MQKVTFQLDEADAHLLAMLAEREGVSEALLLRKAIRAYEPQREGRNLALGGVDEGPGGSAADADAAALLKSFGG